MTAVPPNLDLLVLLKNEISQCNIIYGAATILTRSKFFKNVNFDKPLVLKQLIKY